MCPISDDTAIRAAFAAARELEPTGAEVAEVLARAGEPRRRRSSFPAGSGWRRVAVPALTVLALVASGYAAVPPLRAAIDDAASTFADFLAGEEGEAPGRSLRPGESAAFGFPAGSEPRVIAEADGYQLQFIRVGQGQIEFDLGETGVALGFDLDGLRDHAVYVLGPGAMENADERGHVPLFGVTAPRVTAVELTYESGSPLRVDDVKGGFVLLADPTRAPREVVGYDARGAEVERASVGHIQWDSYGPPVPRVPPECQPGAAGVNPPPSCPAG